MLMLKVHNTAYAKCRVSMFTHIGSLFFSLQGKLSQFVYVCYFDLKERLEMLNLNRF